MSRISAFLIHLGISLVIFAGLAWLVLKVWYPSFFFETDGGWQGLRIIVVVDLVLGPLLTLIVFKSGKPGLKFDLSMIALFQTVALGAGVYIVHGERPIAMLYVDGQFFSAARDDFVEAGVDVPDLDTFPGTGPRWVMVDLPDDPTKQSEIRSRMLQAQTPLRFLTELYVPFAANPTFQSDAYDNAEIEKLDSQHQVLPKWLAAHGGVLADYHFYLFGTRYKYIFLGFRAIDNQRVGLLDLNAYPPETPG